MQDPARFRKYAEECRRLAQTSAPEHRTTLLQIAAAWTECADDAERNRREKPDGQSASNGNDAGSEDESNRA